MRLKQKKNIFNHFFLWRYFMDFNNNTIFS